MSSSTAKPSDRFIPLYIFIFFLLLMLTLGWFVWLSMRGYPGEVTKNAYQQGLHYNRIIAAAAEQVRLGWQGKINTVANGQDVTLTFTFSDKEGHAITGATAIACFIRETQAGYDQKISLTPDGKGGYEGKVSLPLRGEWRVQVSATAQEHNYQQAEYLRVQ